MPGLITKETNRSVVHLIETIQNSSIKKDSKLLLAIMKEITKAEPKVWGNARIPDFIIGFGKNVYKRKGNKTEFEWFKVGFTPCKDKLTIHLNFNLQSEKYLINELGKFKTGKSCLYIRKLADINLDFLIQLIDKSIILQAKTNDKIPK